MRLRYQEGRAKIEWLTGHALNPGRGKSIILCEHPQAAASSTGVRFILCSAPVHPSRKTSRPITRRRQAVCRSLRVFRQCACHEGIRAAGSRLLWRHELAQFARALLRIVGAIPPGFEDPRLEFAGYQL